MGELLAEVRTAEVFAYGEGTVLKLDRPDWNGLAEFEGALLTSLADAGLPVARPHGTVTVEGRSGVILDRVAGPSLAQVLAGCRSEQAEELADRFAGLQLECNSVIVEGLPGLVPRLRARSTSPSPTPRCARSSCGCSPRSTTVRAGSATTTSTRRTCSSVPTDGW